MSILHKPLERYSIKAFNNELFLSGPRKKSYYLRKLLCPQYYNHPNLNNTEAFSIHNTITLKISPITKHKIIYLLYDYRKAEYTPYFSIDHKNNYMPDYIQMGYPIINGYFGYAIKYNYIPESVFDDILNINPF